MPATVVGAQATGNQAYPMMVRRWRWVSVAASAGDQVIVKDVPANGGTARVVYDSGAATGADFGPDEQRPNAKELFVGMQITQMDSGVLYIYL